MFSFFLYSSFSLLPISITWMQWIRSCVMKCWWTLFIMPKDVCTFGQFLISLKLWYYWWFYSYTKPSFDFVFQNWRNTSIKHFRGFNSKRWVPREEDEWLHLLRLSQFFQESNKSTMLNGNKRMSLYQQVNLYKTINNIQWFFKT